MADGCTGEGPLAALKEPYNVNVGIVRAGDWRSSVPSTVTLGVRVGHPRAWSTQQAIAEVEHTIAGIVAGPSSGGDDRDDMTASVARRGYRAEGCLLETGSPLITALGQAHRRTHGTVPECFVPGSTTDARYYVNQARRPALCYGPVARRIHGADEAVELASIVAGARTLARFIAALAVAHG